MIFNEDKLQEEIIKTWGEFGVHNEVFKAMKKQISDLKQLTLTDVVVMYCQCEELANLNDPIIGIDTCIKCDKPIDR